MTDKLLDCPFCGGEANLVGSNQSPPVAAYCKACLSWCSNYPEEKEVIKSWNRRANQKEWIKAHESKPENLRFVVVLLNNEVRPAEFFTSQVIGFYTTGNKIRDCYTEENCKDLNCKFCDTSSREHFLEEGWYQEIEWEDETRYIKLDCVLYWHDLKNPPEQAE